jgi:ABC-type antimicrobial peptide transport system permease subunit
MRFDPLATGLGVFVAIAIPFVVIGYTRPSGKNGTIIALGIVLGLVFGVLAGLWVARRDGHVWRGPQL